MGNLCQDGNGSLIGGGSRIDSLQGCYAWCKASSRCAFFGLTLAPRAPWCIRYAGSCVPRTPVAPADRQYTVYRMLSSTAGAAADSSSAGESIRRRQMDDVSGGGAARGSAVTPPPPEPAPHHCGAAEARCAAAAGRPSSKHRNQIPILSMMTMTPQPDLDSMSHDDARHWVAARWAEWMR